MADIVPPPTPSVSPPSPYYSDESVTLYHGRCEDVLPSIAPESVDVLLTDPPYFNVKDEEWDRQWKQRAGFLSWLGEVLDAATPSLKPSASVWVFASPLLMSTIEREVIDQRFRVLNSIRWVKEAGWHQKAEIEAQRRYLTAWEGIVLAELRESEPDELRKRVMAPVATYIAQRRARAGVSRQVVAKALAASGAYRNEQTGAAMCSDWEYGDSLPTRQGYEVLRSVLGPVLDKSFDELRADWDALLATYYAERRPFRLSRTGPVTDIWNYKPVMGYPSKHPCEKPLAMLDHMLDVSSKPGALILDPFAGSGSTLRAAKDAGRRAIGIEMDEAWCEKAAQRLCQDVLDFGEASA